VTEVLHVDADGLRASVERALAEGERFAGAWASTDGGRAAWRLLMSSSRGMRVLSCSAEREVPSITDLVQAADWDEREAHDLHGVRFGGDRPMRSLASHSARPEDWMTPVSGGGVHQVAVGPVHAGVIESGHFRLHVVGERILAMDPRLFYKHRGLQRAASGQGAADAIVYAQRACAACAVTNSVAYAQAVEEALGLQPDRHLRVSRTVLLELERLYNHLNDIGALCAGVGYAPGTMAFAALKDRAQQVNMRAFGHRFLFGTVSVGDGVVSLSSAEADVVRAELRELQDDLAPAWRELSFAGSVQARLEGVGILDADAAQRIGAVGPAARAAGVREDARSTSSHLAYDGFAPASIHGATGDVASRLRVRAAELDYTCELLQELLAREVPAGSTSAAGAPSPMGVGQVESPRGASVCSVELAGERLARVHLRTGSYANWPALAWASAGNLLPDFPLINKSFELCYACVDR
jgi:Ni,Fe-hydrogenase III large subunit